LTKRSEKQPKPKGLLTPLSSLIKGANALHSPIKKDTTMTTATTADDSLHSVSDTMGEGIKNASAAAARAGEKVREIGGTLGRSISRFTYKGAYMVSYGVVYATVFVASAVPRQNPLVEGLMDGGRAAIDALNEAKQLPSTAS
jgi:hypothetical protein